MRQCAFLILSVGLMLGSTAWSTPGLLMTSDTQTGRGNGGTQILVYDDGQVVESHAQGSGPMLISPLAVLSAPVVQGLRKQIDALPSPLTLIDPNPHGPHCMNTLSTRLSVTQSRGQEIVIKIEAGCHVRIPAPGGPYAEDLSQVLEAFSTLNRLK